MAVRRRRVFGRRAFGGKSTQQGRQGIWVRNLATAMFEEQNDPLVLSLTHIVEGDWQRELPQASNTRKRGGGRLERMLMGHQLSVTSDVTAGTISFLVEHLLTFVPDGTTINSSSAFDVFANGSRGHLLHYSAQQVPHNAYVIDASNNQETYVLQANKAITAKSKRRLEGGMIMSAMRVQVAAPGSAAPDILAYAASSWSSAWVSTP